MIMELWNLIMELEQLDFHSNTGMLVMPIINELGLVLKEH